jgi:hypothetical protein
MPKLALMSLVVGVTVAIAYEVPMGITVGSAACCISQLLFWLVDYSKRQG